MGAMSRPRVRSARPTCAATSRRPACAKSGCSRVPAPWPRCFPNSSPPPRNAPGCPYLSCTPPDTPRLARSSNVEQTRYRRTGRNDSHWRPTAVFVTALSDNGPRWAPDIGAGSCSSIIAAHQKALSSSRSASKRGPGSPCPHIGSESPVRRVFPCCAGIKQLRQIELSASGLRPVETRPITARRALCHSTVVSVVAGNRQLDPIKLAGNSRCTNQSNRAIWVSTTSCSAPRAR